MSRSSISPAGYATDSIRIGQLIQADLFAVLEGSGDDKSPRGLIVYDAATGLRLWDSASPSDSPDGAADAIVEGVRQAAGGSAARRHKGVRLAQFGTRGATSIWTWLTRGSVRRCRC